ncbi:TPA: DotD/TraH family lipoprotein [Salmonella enterica subsp. salamae serovar 35:g,m,s,t:-]|nr:DotD/TraH family lipoprotein [Salmonella enterica subsp. salamae serovar 35:g,m,s,t:-]HCA3549696.1 DotD/TraH family lipoprotein [Salmonella enterica subsp. salamae serovar 35:g,m,s,t:-]
MDNNYSTLKFGARHLLCSLGLFALTGCTVVIPSQEQSEQAANQKAIEDNLSDVATTLGKVQFDLSQGTAGLNQAKKAESLHIDSDGQFVSVSWDGDAVTLLDVLAHERGQNFSYSGVRLPLPIGIHDISTPYWDVIDHIQAQIGYRAVIVIDNDANELSLQFNGPNNVTTDERVSVIRKGSSMGTTPMPAMAVTNPSKTRQSGVSEYSVGRSAPTLTWDD